MDERSDLIVAALKEQIGNLSFDNAVLRADVTVLTNEKKAREAKDYADSLPK